MAEAGQDRVGERIDQNRAGERRGGLHPDPRPPAGGGAGTATGGTLSGDLAFAVLQDGLPAGIRSAVRERALSPAGPGGRL